MDDHARVVCGKCKVDPEIVADPSGEVEAVCPSCGQRDDVDDAVRIASEQFTEMAARSAQGGLSSETRGHKFVMFEVEPLPPRTFRWHAV